MLNLFHKYDASKKCMNIVSYMCLSKEYIIKVIMDIKLVLTSMTKHVEFLKRTMSSLITRIATLRIRLAYPAAEPEAPESDMVLRCCSRPAGCSAEMLQ